MGSAVAIATAVVFPQRVQKLILIGGFPDKVRENLTSPLFSKAIDSRLPLWVMTLGNWVLGRSFTEDLLKELVYDPTLLTNGVLDRSYRNRQNNDILHPQKSLMSNLELWENGFGSRIQEVSHRTLIIWGKNDKLFPTYVGENLSQKISGSHLHVINDAGHMVQWEKPDVVNRLVIDFISRD
jgi:pimeloyl-ACP methyl ester carboxylesterase